MANQVFGYDVWANEKRTSDCPLKSKFLNSLPVGTTVYRESEEYDVFRKAWVDVMEPIGAVREGEFGDNVFEPRKRPSVVGV